jgi:XRE family aerobic/anaerobic benzoate catabolism transcriptional regulator
MQDLKSILSSREAFYSKANFQLNTSSQGLNETFLLLLEIVSNTLRGIEA